MGENYGPSIGEIFLTITQDTKVVRENTNNLTSSRTGCRTGDWFQIGKGVHQGCVLSPYLFNLYAEYIRRNSGLDDSQAGIKIARRNMRHLSYADDITLMRESTEELKSLLMRVKEESEKAPLAGRTAEPI